MTSFIDNNFKYVKSFISRDYTELAEEISNIKSNLTYYIEDNNSIFGYAVSKNTPVSNIYGVEVFSVRFYFANVDTLHNELQENNIVKLVANLKEHINNNKGYYALRIPSHIVDLVRAINGLDMKYLLCGGTVEQYINNTSVDANNKSNLDIFLADQNYIVQHRRTLLDMTYSSFESYQGQYHISDFMYDKAGQIYENWIEYSLSGNSDDKIVVAEKDGEPIGFVTIAEDDFAVEGVLSAVSSAKRQFGAYKAMISYIINYANDNGKCFITSTQFDNFIVQGTWNTLGLKPFYSIYNVHINNVF